MRRGISLVEVLITIAILSGAIAVFAALLNIIKLDKSGTLYTSAYKIAQEELESVRSLPFSDLTARTDSSFIGVLYNNGAAAVNNDPSANSLPNNLELARGTASSSIALVPSKLGDFTFEFYAKASSTMEKTGLIFRARDLENYYIFYITNNKLALDKYADGAQTNIYQTPQSFSAGTWYKLKVIASGSSISLYLNDNLMTTASDSSLANEYAALYSENNQGSFDDINLTDDLSQNFSWNFDESEDLPPEWQRFGMNDLPQGAGKLTISEPYGADSGLKKIDVSVNWKERESTKTITLSTMKGE